MSKVLVILSGGQDSTTCLFWAKQNYDEVHAITFDYSQRHTIEIDAAIKVAKLAGVCSHSIVKIPDCLESTSPLVSDNKLKSYSDVNEQAAEGRADTFVPMRNALFLTIAANRAEFLGADSLVVGVNEADTGGYDDCRACFIDAAADYINKALGRDRTGKRMLIKAPLQGMSKSDIVIFSKTLKGCMAAMAHTHTCYAGVYPPCGSCHSCVLRESGFFEAGEIDPIFNR